MTRRDRVLIVGRSAGVLLAAVAMLRQRGYHANATNQFDRLLDDYDCREVDLVLFGGMVPPDVKEELQREIRALNPRVRLLQGLGGIAPLLVAQVEEQQDAGDLDIGYDPAARVVHLALDERAPVVVECLWGTFVPPEPVGHAMIAFEGDLGPGEHEVPVPDEVPAETSFVAVRVGGRVSVLPIGVPPPALARIAPGSLPAPEPVSTRHPWA